MKTANGVIVVFLIATALMVAPAEATPVTVEGCSNCYGSTYTLDVTGSGTVLDVFLTINTDNFSGPPKYQFISAVDFKVTPGVDSIVNATLISPPEGWVTDFNSASLNSGSGGLCSADVNAGFVCSAGSPVEFVKGQALTWHWKVELASGVQPFDGLYGSHIGAKYDDLDGGVKGWITSTEVAAPVPEPSTLLLLGSGLLGLGGFAWRRNRKG